MVPNTMNYEQTLTASSGISHGAISAVSFDISAVFSTSGPYTERPLRSSTPFMSIMSSVTAVVVIVSVAVIAFVGVRAKGELSSLFVVGPSICAA